MRQKLFGNRLWLSWFTEGVDDPRITVIKVEPVDGYYWDTKNVMVAGLVKRAIGAAIGKTMEILSKEGLV